MALQDDENTALVARGSLVTGNSSIDTRLIRDIYCGPETCVAMKFVDDDDDDVYVYVQLTWSVHSRCCV